MAQTLGGRRGFAGLPLAVSWLDDEDLEIVLDAVS